MTPAAGGEDAPSELSRRIEKLGPGHALGGFDCGREELNRYLAKYAQINQRAGAGQTYVGLVGETVVGYHTLAAGHVLPENAPARVIKGLPRNPVPVILLARLAVDTRWQGRGIGRALLKDAILRTLQVAEIAGIRALVAHAKDESAKAFYLKWGFVESPTDPLHMMVLLKDVRGVRG